jgi:hypothetical protein
MGLLPPPVPPQLPTSTEAAIAASTLHHVVIVDAARTEAVLPVCALATSRLQRFPDRTGNSTIWHG